MEDLRILKCLNTSWKQDNIIQNTLWYKKFREANRKKNVVVVIVTQKKKFYMKKI